MDDRELAQAAVYLRNAAPDQYDELIKAFERLALQATSMLLDAKQDSFMTNQGWAKATHFFLRCFKNPELRIAGPKRPTADR